MMLNNLNLNLLRSLHVLLDECHVSRAAERLNLTQSAVSRQLSQLRELCADPLLVRAGNRLVPTPRALAIQAKLNLLLGEFNQILSEKPFEPQTWQQEFVVSSSDYVAQYIIPEVACVITQQAPLVNLAYRLWQPDFLDNFHDSGIHLASTMLADKPANVTSIKIGQDKSLCLMRKGHPLAQQRSLSVDDLVAYPHVKVTGGGDKDTNVDLALKARGVTRRIGLKVPFFSAAVNAVLSGEYLMIVPEHIAINLAKTANLVHFPLPFDTPFQQYWLLWHPRYDNDQAHQWMRTQILHALQTSPYSIGMM